MFKLINNDLCVFSMYSGSLLSINIQMNYELNGQLHIECSCEVQCKWLVENQGFPWLWNPDTHCKYTNVPNIVIVENFSALLFFTFYRKPAISILYQLLMVWAFLLKMFEIFTITSLNNFLTHTWKGINFMFRHVWNFLVVLSLYLTFCCCSCSPGGGEDLHGHGSRLRRGEAAVSQPSTSPCLRILPQESKQGCTATSGLLSCRHLQDLRSRGPLHIPWQTQGEEVCNSLDFEG